MFNAFVCIILARCRALNYRMRMKYVYKIKTWHVS